MLEQIENKIEELKQLRAEEYYKKKDEDLKAWGLTTKTDGKKVTPIIVTDDEYEELVKASNGVGKIGRNSTSIFLNIFSYIVIVLGIVAGAVIAQFTEGLAFVSFTVSVIIAIIVAVLMRGIGEAIRLLQQLIDSKPIQRPDPIGVRKQPPHVKRATPKNPPPPYYPPYPPQQQPNAPQQPYAPYPPYPSYQKTSSAQQPLDDSSAYNTDTVQAYYQSNSNN